MSEIEKMNIRCKIKKQQTCSHSDTCYNGSLNECEGCNAYQYPEFTAEKQLELIKWLCKTRDFAFEGIFINDIYYLSCRQTKNINTGKYYISNVENKKFEDALAGLINVMWQDLTDTEKAEIKRILE